MLFSIVTPSFNASSWLKLCVSSVSDQPVKLEHIVQDAGSTDGTLAWLQHDMRVKAFVEKDKGMYDAVNRGLRRAQGEVLTYLNCDEQYLPGALPAVCEFFKQNPQVDVAFGDFVVVNGRGEYLFHRKVQPPLKYHTWISHLPAFSCAMFFRRKLIHEKEIFFDSGLRDVGDAEWVLRLLKQKVRMGVLRRFTSVFTITGVNMCVGPNALRERQELHASAPFWARKLKYLLILHHRLRRLAGGIYFQRPFTFALYSLANPGQRIIRDVARPKFQWQV